MNIYERAVVAAVMILVSVECLFLVALYRQERKRVDAIEQRLYKLENAKQGQTP